MGKVLLRRRWVMDMHYSNGTLVVVHDGSYMPYVQVRHAHVASFYVAVTPVTVPWAHLLRRVSIRATIVGNGSESEACRSFWQCWTLHYFLPTLFCWFRLTVTNHNCNLNGTLPEKQKQADMIRLCPEYRGRIPFPVQYNHVDGHLDKLLRWDQLSEEQKENCMMDIVAKTALLDAVIDDNFISGYFPHENVVVTVDGEKVSGSQMTAIGNAWGCKMKVARELFHSKKIVDKKYFGTMIYWDGVEKSIASFPKMFRVWVTACVSFLRYNSLG